MATREADPDLWGSLQGGARRGPPAGRQKQRAGRPERASRCSSAASLAFRNLLAVLPRDRDPAGLGADPAQPGHHLPRPGLPPARRKRQRERCGSRSPPTSRRSRSSPATRTKRPGRETAAEPGALAARAGPPAGSGSRPPTWSTRPASAWTRPGRCSRSWAKAVPAEGEAGVAPVAPSRRRRQPGHPRQPPVGPPGRAGRSSEGPSVWLSAIDSLPALFRY